MTAEEKEQAAIAEYMRWQYPDVLFNADMGGVRLPIGLATKMKRLGNMKGYPDLFMPEPRHGFYGLYIELKAPKTRLKKRNGDWANEHIAHQADILEKLRTRGFKAEFAIGFDHARDLIDEYFHSAPDNSQHPDTS